MDPPQTPRQADDPGVGRGLPMQGKPNSGLSPGFQQRPQGLQGQPPGSPRYPVNNGPVGGPRLGGPLQQQQQPPLNRLDSKLSLGSPTTGPPNQFSQSRPPFAGPRPQNVQGVPPPGGYPRGPPLQGNPGLQGPRYPPPGSAPGIRGPVYPQPGQRPILNNNPQQQIRFQRPDLGPPQSQPRFGPFPYNPENRQPGPQNNQIPFPRDPNLRPPLRPQNMNKMEVERPNSSLSFSGSNSAGPMTPKSRPMSQNRDVIDDDDDDDVVMDSEKAESPFPQDPRISSASVRHEISASPSPKASNSSTPVPSDYRADEQRPRSRLSETSRSSYAENENDVALDMSRQSSAKSARSPTKLGCQTPDIRGISPSSMSPGPMGFDNGIPRSLSPKSPNPMSSPMAPNSPQLPDNLKPETEKKRATFAEDIDNSEGKKENERSRPGTPKPATPTKSPIFPETPKSSMKRSTSARSIKSDAGSESGANKLSYSSTPTSNGAVSPTKKMPPKSGSPMKSPSKSARSLPRTPEAGPPSTAEKKKVSMNKVQVGAAPSPNLKTVRSKIGSLDNASYKPGGGKVKIENRKLDFSKAQPKIAAKNDKYAPSGGEKKITHVKLQWNAKPKVGSMDNATYKPGGGDKKIETVKLDFKDKAKPKVGSKDNAKHVPGGGTVKSMESPLKTPQESRSNIETLKIDIKAESKIGSLDNVKHKPGGGDKKIFNDVSYLRQTSSNSNAESVNGSGAQSPVPNNSSFIEGKNGVPTSDENLNEEC